MRRLSSIILFILIISGSIFAQKSPHGTGFAISCKDCHTTDGWKIDLAKLAFDHSVTKPHWLGSTNLFPARIAIPPLNL
ncbi:MAG: hypothetical protein IPH84_17140 [Bacteroidales bacterium]|nr:hypothetical protein [Bacteroidales bacterium]